MQIQGESEISIQMVKEVTNVYFIVINSILWCCSCGIYSTSHSSISTHMTVSLTIFADYVKMFLLLFVDSQYDTSFKMVRIADFFLEKLCICAPEDASKTRIKLLFLIIICKERCLVPFVRLLAIADSNCFEIIVCCLLSSSRSACIKDRTYSFEFLDKFFSRCHGISPFCAFLWRYVLYNGWYYSQQTD